MRGSDSIPNSDESDECDERMHIRYWSARCSTNAKLVGIVLLVMAFFGQTYLVYADPVETQPLTEDAVRGRMLWQTSNCQTCHQLYGFGGFLGPDLTNVASRITQSQFEHQLEVGSTQMPKFDFVQEDRDALWAFLDSMNKTGMGQARNKSQLTLGKQEQVFDSVRSFLYESGNPGAVRGFEIFQTSSCIGCHVLFGESAVGAPDLTRVGNLLTSEEILHVLEAGRLPKMPPSGLSMEDRIAMQEFISHVSAHRDEINLPKSSESFGEFWLSLPWWEFDK